MKAMRILAVTMLALAATTAQAQGGGQGGMGQGGQGMQRQNEMLFKGITLSEEQKVKIDSVQAANRTAMRALMQAGGMQDSTTRAKAMEMRKKHNADLRALLTPEQQVQFDKNLAEMPQPGMGRRPPGGR